MSRQQKVKTKLTLANGRTSSSSPPKEHCNIYFKFVSDRTVMLCKGHSIQSGEGGQGGGRGLMDTLKQYQ